MSEKITIPQLYEMKKHGERIVSLTAYDASFAKILDQAKVEIILIGDSLGMVLHGEQDTLKVTMEDMIYHSRLVSRGVERALIVTDLPYGSYISLDEAERNARRLIEEGRADIVKLEGADELALEIVKCLTGKGIAVCGHVGLQPQSVKKYGGYKVQGRNESDAQRILEETRALELAGASMVVLECIPSELARKITESVDIPTIGIGAGPECDGQVLVLYDVLGISQRIPKMAKDFLKEEKSVFAAVQHYFSAVKSGTFPGSENSFS